MSKKADEGWTGKNKMPPLIPPYKTPRLVSVENKMQTRKKPAVVDISETEAKDSGSEEETQFGVVWEKMTEVQKMMPAPVKKERFPVNKGKNIIEHITFAESYFTPKRLFMQHEIEQYMLTADGKNGTKSEKQAHRAFLKF